MKGWTIHLQGVIPRGPRRNSGPTGGSAPHHWFLLFHNGKPRIKCASRLATEGLDVHSSTSNVMATSNLLKAGHDLWQRQSARTISLTKNVSQMAVLLLLPYLEGSLCRIRTGQNTIKCTSNLADAADKLARRHLWLSRMEFNPVHHTVNKHHAADSFSRLPTSVQDLTPIRNALPVPDMLVNSHWKRMRNYVPKLLASLMTTTIMALTSTLQHYSPFDFLWRLIQIRTQLQSW